MVKLLIIKMGRNWIFIISFLFANCANNQVAKTLIPRDDFRDILIEIHKLDLSLTGLQRDTVSLLDSLLISRYFNQDLYRKTLLFYSDKPSEMLNILYEVQDSISS